MNGFTDNEIRTYLDHTKQGMGIREIARERGGHASTFLRQIRRVEDARNDPIVEAYLDADDAFSLFVVQDPDDQGQMLKLVMPQTQIVASLGFDNFAFVQGSGKHLTRVGQGSIKDLGRWILKGWVATRVREPGKPVFYNITEKGKLIAKPADKVPTPDAPPAAEEGGAKPKPRRQRRVQSALWVKTLTQMKDWIDDADLQCIPIIQADFYNTITPGTDIVPTATWADYGTKIDTTVRNSLIPQAWWDNGSSGRFEELMRALGPGLADVILLHICHERGIEDIEKLMGWSARSGKVVLAIAVQHAARFYAGDESADYIG